MLVYLCVLEQVTAFKTHVITCICYVHQLYEMLRKNRTIKGDKRHCVRDTAVSMLALKLAFRKKITIV